MTESLHLVLSLVAATAVGGCTVTETGFQQPFAVVADNQHYPDHLRVDGDTVYWTTTYTVSRAPADGGAPAVVTDGLFRPVGLVVNGSTLFTLVEATYGLLPNDCNSTTFCPTQVLAIDAELGQVSVLAENGHGAEPHGLESDGVYLYWLNQSRVMENGSCGDIGPVRRARIDDGSIETLADRQVYATGIAVAADQVFWTSAGTGQTVAGACGWTNEVGNWANGRSLMAATAPSETRTITTMPGDGPTWIRSDGAGLIVYDNGSSTLSEFDPTTEIATTIAVLDTPNRALYAIASDADALYLAFSDYDVINDAGVVDETESSGVVEYTTSTIRRIDRTDGSTTILGVVDDGPIRSLAPSSDQLFMTTDDKVLRLPKLAPAI